ncbi:GNAT family N-acetyltransferase [Sinomicrobium soli]|uniref:GNAT family N-acetyltransferase n=1 Tax=Sinomicrobium sp. N-1-3-6 TaxID=2219864 RepID=UPI000DCC281F|nr:GNAT family N-acetyltransferase [Sinomicrobium sp. N-1-3-6]RAV28012.1 GNAT family N-acetyltransferase [Sinomicrobium sp. N-1-3-6]
MQPYTIRNAGPEDMPEVLRLIRELADYEKEPEAVEITSDDLVRDGFGPRPLFHCFVADTGNDIAGIALVYPRYSTWKGMALHLEDLIVSEAYRGRGLGKALLSEVVRYGHELGVKRICWEVLDWNEPAIDFYEKQGARILRDWDVVHLDAEGIAGYMSGTGSR